MVLQPGFRLVVGGVALVARIQQTRGLAGCLVCIK